MPSSTETGKCLQVGAQSPLQKKARGMVKLGITSFLEGRMLLESSTSSLSFLLCSDAAYSSFADPLEEPGSLQPQEISLYSDGELLEQDR